MIGFRENMHCWNAEFDFKPCIPRCPWSSSTQFVPSCKLQILHFPGNVESNIEMNRRKKGDLVFWVAGFRRLHMLASKTPVNVGHISRRRSRNVNIWFLGQGGGREGQLQHFNPWVPRFHLPGFWVSWFFNFPVLRFPDFQFPDFDFSGFSVTQILSVLEFEFPGFLVTQI